MSKRQLSARMRRHWTGKKAPLVEDKFVAEVLLDGDRAIPLQEMANRHAEEGFHVKREIFDKPVESNWGYSSLKTFLRVTISRRQLEMGRDA